MNESGIGAWRDWLTRQRWFGDKSRRLERIAVDALTTINLDGESATLALVTCTFTSSPGSTYQVAALSPASLAADEPVDAFAHPAFHSWLYTGFAQLRSVPAGKGRTLRWVPGVVAGPTLTAPEGRILSAEQSNTSIRFGDEAILKVFRRLHAGINPDPELLRFLGSRTSYRHVPPDLGTIELRNADGGTVVLAAMQGFVPNVGDCWSWLLTELRAAGTGDEDTLLDSIGLLGRRTAELHLALASGSDDPVFSIERMTASRLSRTRDRRRSELETTLQRLQAGRIRDARQLGALRDALVLRLESGDGMIGSAICRIHGDFHLGQVLRTAGDFVIIDFEGEPSRPFEERREKASPLRDVAGMLRSIDYAVATVRNTSAGEEWEGMDRFASLAGQRFIGAYAEGMADGKSMLLPTDPEALRAVLEPFLVEKALYEVRYELDNRPDWVEIPLRALEALTG